MHPLVALRVTLGNLRGGGAARPSGRVKYGPVSFRVNLAPSMADHRLRAARRETSASFPSTLASPWRSSSQPPECGAVRRRERVLCGVAEQKRGKEALAVA